MIIILYHLRLFESNYVIINIVGKYMKISIFTYLNLNVNLSIQNMYTINKIQ